MERTGKAANSDGREGPLRDQARGRGAGRLRGSPPTGGGGRAGRGPPPPPGGFLRHVVRGLRGRLLAKIGDPCSGWECVGVLFLLSVKVVELVGYEKE